LAKKVNSGVGNNDLLISEGTPGLMVVAVIMWQNVVCIAISDPFATCLISEPAPAQTARSLIVPSFLASETKTAIKYQFVKYCTLFTLLFKRAQKGRHLVSVASLLLKSAVGDFPTVENVLLAVYVCV
jgi:hypothetical protein